jgi:beta-lactamase class A
LPAGLATLILAVLFLSGFFLGRKMQTGDNGQSKEIRQSSGYAFINPLLECEVGNESPILKSAELKVKKAIQEQIIDKNPSASIAFYYRDLNNGPTFGINEQSSYSPASLLKVPIMLAYYKYSEHDPTIFGKSLTAGKPATEFSQQIQPEKRISEGKSYTVSQLIEAMIKYSDNDATNLLFQNVNQKDFGAVFSDLGINMPEIYNANNSMTVKDYASFFRILYNASYLNRGLSEQALALLGTVDYKGGLLAGTPKGITVAHKFGERESLGDDKQVVRQLHDCGIVYHPQRPYLLCVMTKGQDFTKLSHIIAGISKIIYDQVDSGAR